MRYNEVVRISRFDWDDANEQNMARHGVHPSEVEEVLRHDPYIRRGRDRRYLAYGRTGDGRLLFVVFTMKAEGAVRVINARDMTRRERLACRRKR